ncbi:MAG: HAD family phosphatase [Elusimicrobiota bacterium]
MKKKYKAVLFDFDGVIGKTMEDNYKAWNYAFSKYGIEIDKTEYFLLEGMSVEKIAEHFLRQNSKNLNLVSKIVKLKEKSYIQNNKFSLYPGVKHLIPKLKKNGYLLGLVSGGIFERIKKSLKKFLKFFDVVITGDKIKKCKPNPIPYLTAVKKLKVEPSRCLVVENAPLGIESAKRAGIYCIAVCSTLNKKYLKKADKIINNLVELKYVLE